MKKNIIIFFLIILFLTGCQRTILIKKETFNILNSSFNASTDLVQALNASTTFMIDYNSSFMVSWLNDLVLNLTGLNESLKGMIDQNSSWMMKDVYANCTGADVVTGVGFNNTQKTIYCTAVGGTYNPTPIITNLTALNVSLTGRIDSNSTVFINAIQGNSTRYMNYLDKLNSSIQANDSANRAYLIQLNASQQSNSSAFISYLVQLNVTIAQNSSVFAPAITNIMANLTALNVSLTGKIDQNSSTWASALTNVNTNLTALNSTTAKTVGVNSFTNSNYFVDNLLCFDKNSTCFNGTTNEWFSNDTWRFNNLTFFKNITTDYINATTVVTSKSVSGQKGSMTGYYLSGMINDTAGNEAYGAYFQVNGRDYSAGSQFGWLVFVADARNTSNAASGLLSFMQRTGPSTYLTRLAVNNTGGVGMGGSITSTPSMTGAVVIIDTEHLQSSVQIIYPTTKPPTPVTCIVGACWFNATVGTNSLCCCNSSNIWEKQRNSGGKC